MNKLNYSDESIICSSIVDKNHSNNYDHDTNQCIGPGHLVDELAQLGDMRSASSTSGMKWRHFIIKSNRILTPEDIHAVACEVLDLQDYKVRRIVKPLFSYNRLTVRNTLQNISMLVDMIAGKLNAKAKEQLLKRRPDLELVSGVTKHISKVMTLNINGITGKLEELQMLLERNKPDVICLQETKRVVNGKKLHINGYIIYEVPAEDSGLGLLMGLRNGSGLQFHILESNRDAIVASIRGRDASVVLGNIYRSPSRKSEANHLVANMLRKYSKESNFLLVGDWNETPDVMTRVLNRLGIDVWSNNAPTKGTRIMKNRKRTKRPIDFGISSHDHLIISQKVSRKWMLSDHLPVMVSIGLSHNVGDMKTIVCDRKRLYEPKVVEAIMSHEYPISGDDVLMNIKRFHEELNSVLKEHKVIREEYKKQYQLLLPRPVRRAICSKRLVDDKVRKGLAPVSELLLARKTVQQQIKLSKHESYNRFIKRGINYLKHNDSRNAWKWIRTHAAFGKKSSDIEPVYKVNSNIVESNPDERLKIWANHFRSLCLAAPQWVAPDINICENPVIKEITDSDVTWTEVQAVLKKLRKGKAAGNDMIPGEVYKLVQNETIPNSQLSKSILALLNGIYNGTGFPLEWRDCTVVPIFKKGDKHDPNNYRGIALINTLLKVLTKVIAARLQVVCCEMKLIRREQVGFIRGEEGIAQAACLLEACQRRSIRGQDTVLCFLDLRKAYDLVPHDRLIFKLRKFGLGSKMIDFIERMYEDTFMRVRVNNQLTESFKFERGVRQGCPTSPLLFDIYINDILDGIEPVAVQGLGNGLSGLMFADDTVILANDNNDLQVKLESINRWMSCNAMEVNPSKCGIMYIGGNNSIHDPVVYNGEVIPRVDRYVYLGIEFNKDLDLQEMARFRLIKGKKTLLSLSNTLKNPRVPLEYRSVLIKSILIPTLHYGAEVFGMSEMRLNKLKRVLDNALKLIVKKSNFCRLRVYEEFDIKPLYISAAVSRTRGIKKWSGSNGLISDLIASQSSFKSKKSTWIKEAKRWLKLMKIDLNLPSKDLLSQVVTNRSNRLLERDRSVIGSWARNLFIRSGKSIRRVELFGSHHRGVNMLMKIRTGCISMTNQLVRSMRLDSSLMNSCVCCKEKVKEDIEHLIFECSAFTDLREKYMPYLDDNSVDRCIKLTKLLGGERQTSCSRKTPREVLECIEYLSWVVVRRSSIIARSSNL